MAIWLFDPRTTSITKLMTDMNFAPVKRHSDCHQPKGTWEGVERQGQPVCRYYLSPAKAPWGTLN